MPDEDFGTITTARGTDQIGYLQKEIDDHI